VASTEANVACLIDWLKIASLNNWLGSKPGKSKQREGARPFRGAAKGIIGRMAETRARLGLSAAYGPAAIKLGFLAGQPPSDLPPPKLA
jgi:hypothetical protein